MLDDGQNKPRLHGELVEQSENRRARRAGRDGLLETFEAFDGGKADLGANRESVYGQ